MKNLLTKVLVVAMAVACTGLLLGCGQTPSKISDEEVEFEREMEEADPDEEEDTEEKTDTAKKEKENKEEEMESKEQEKDKETTQVTSVITEYKWQASGDSSMIVCGTDGSFRYYRSAEDLTNNYYEGTYEFYMGKDAVSYITTELSAYGVTEEELEGVFDRNEQYEESNFVIFVLNNEACIVDGENIVDSPYQTPYFGFYLEEDGVPYLDIANMNSGNYNLFVGK